MTGGLHHRAAYFVRKTSESLRQSVMLQVVAVSTIAIAVLVLGAFLLVLKNLDLMAERWSAETRLVAFLSEDAGPSQLTLAARACESWPEVEAVETLTRQQALQGFRKALGGDAALLDGVDSALVPASITLRLRPDARTADMMAELADRMGRLPGLGAVSKMDAGQDLVARFQDLQGLLKLAGGVLSSLVAFAVIFIISNTVRLTLYARKEELEIMLLVGATPRFVQIPVYLEGILQGMLGAGTALAVLWITWKISMPGAVPTLRFGALELPVVFLSISASLGVILGAGAVGLLASHLASSRFLKRQD